MTEQSKRRPNPLNILILVAALMLVWYVFASLPVTYNDWVKFFGPAARQWWQPYEVQGILNPPWIFPLLYPLGALPHPWGAGGLILLSVGAVMLYTRSMPKTLAVIVSAPFVFLVVVGQLDALILYGLLIPSGLGLPLILIKPQAAFATGLIRINRQSIALMAAVGVVSVLIWGFWWQHMLGVNYDPDPSRNLSLFPYSIVPGVILIYYGIKHEHDGLLCLASLMLTPFFQVHSMVPAVATLIAPLDKWYYYWLVSLGSWGYYFLLIG